MTTEVIFCYIKIKKHSEIERFFKILLDINSNFRRSLDRHNHQHLVHHQIH